MAQFLFGTLQIQPHFVNNNIIIDIFKAHSKCINRILWNESKQLLLTGSDDEIIK